jgi:PAS domain S-box-containing protein
VAMDHRSEGSQTPMASPILRPKFPLTFSISVKITAIYFAVGTLWILFSDTVLGLVIRDPSVMTKLSIAKGWCYVLLTALMLYMLVRRGTAEMTRDIAERKQAEQALLDSEANLNRAQEIAHIGSWHLDTTRNQLTWSNEVYRIFDIPIGTALSYEDFLHGVHPEDRERVDRAWAAALQGAPYDIEHRILVGGKSKWVRERAEVELDREGKAVKGIGTVQDITELKRAEEAVREERQRLFDVLETLPIMVSLLKPDYKVVFVNRGVRDRCGESHGRPCYEYRFGFKEPCEFCETTEVLKMGLPHHWEFTGPDGRVIDAHSLSFTDVDGSPMMLEMHIDITERKSAEEKIRQQEIELRQMLDFAPQLVAVFGPDRERLYANQPALDYFGVTLEEWQGISDRFRFFHPDDRERVPTDVYTEPGSDVPHEFEARLRRKDGAHRWFLFRDNALRNEQGQIARWYLSATDIEDRKNAEETLRRLNRELRAISNCNQTLMRATDEQSLLEEICRIVCEEIGYRMAWVGYAEHDAAKSVRPVAWTGAEEGYLATANITWADTERGRGPAGTAIRTGESCYIQDYATDPQFSPWRESALQRGFRSGIVLPLKDEDAGAFGCLCIYSEQPNAFTPEEIRLLEELADDLAFGIVTLRSRAARKRAEQEVALLSFALDKIGEAAFLIDDTGRFQYVNEEACRVLGYTREELLGLRVSDIDPDFPAERRSELWRDLKTRRSASFESHHLTKDGHIFPVEVGANHFEYGDRAYDLALARDITERKRAEEALRSSESYLAEAQRLTHTGSFAFDVASNKYIYVSEECSRIFELDAQEDFPSREAVSRLIHPEDWDRVKEDFEKLLREKVDTLSEFRIALPSGTAKHIQAIRHAVLNDAGEVATVVGTAIDITERKRAEEALRRSEAYLAEAQRVTHTGSFSYQPGGALLYCSDETLQIWGFDLQQPIPNHELFRQRIHPGDRDRVHARAEASVETKTDWDDEFRIVLPDGTVKHIQGIHHPVFGSSGELREVVGTHIDITQRKRAEEERSRLAAIVESSHDAIISKNLDGTIMSWNEGAERLYGYSAAEALGRPVTFLTPPDQWDEIADILKRIREGIRIEQYETERVRKDGQKINVSLTVSPVRNHRGRVIGASTIARDITELKHAQNEVLNHLRYFQSMDRINRAMHGTNDLERMMGEILDAMLLIFDSDRAWLVYPCDPDAASWRVTMERAKPEYPGGDALAGDIPMNPDTRSRFQLIADGPGVVTFGPEGDYPLVGEVPERFGHKSQISIALNPKTGKPWILGMQHCSYPRVWTQDEKKLLEEIARRVTDVVTALLAHRDLHESEERHRVTLQTAMDGFFLTDMQGRILEVNQTYCRMTRYTEQELLNMHIADIEVLHTTEMIAANIRRFAEEGSMRFESVHRRKDGSLFDVEISGQYQPIAGGQAVVFVRDITERRKAQEALQKLLGELESRVEERTKQLSEANQSLQAANKELESFSYSVSHDLRAPLRAIDGFSMMVLKGYADKLDDEGRRKLNVIRSNARQMGRLIDDLLTFSRLGRKELVNVSLDMEAIVLGAWSELTLLKPEQRIDFSVQRLPYGMGDPALIKEVVINLLSNAMKFTRYRETAVVEVGAHSEKEINVYFVKDNGAGFNMEYYDKLFGVFQRLHSSDEFEGTGVGLAIVERIIVRHGGRVWAEGKEGEGATFYFTLARKGEG